MRCSFGLFSGFSSASSVPAGSFANASSVGANTVNGPAPFSVSTRSAAWSAFASVLNDPAATAVSMMSLSAVAAPMLAAAPVMVMAATIPAIVFFICLWSVIELRVDELTSRDRRGLGPAVLHALPRHCLIQPHQTVDQCADCRDLTELHPEQSCDEVEPGHGNEPPVERSDDDENRGDDVDLLHDSSSCAASGTSPAQCMY